MDSHTQKNSENGWHHTLPRKLVNRERYILDHCRGKSVLHLGCVDYPVTVLQIKTGRWLHSQIMKVADEVVGIDLDKPGIEDLKKNGIDNILYGNVEDLSPLNLGAFDVIVAGEIIEHLNNPGLFLKQMKKVMHPDSILIVTTVNAYCLRRILRIPFGKESVHPDHVYYFSHSTLTSLLERFDYKIIDRASQRLTSNNVFLARIFDQIASLISPNLSEGIVYAVKK